MNFENNVIVFVFILLAVVVFPITELSEIKSRTLTITAYSSTVDQTDSTPFETACMTEPAIWTVAVSQDLYDMGWTCGKCVDIHGVGILCINDKMHHRKKNQLDVWVRSRGQAKRFGIMKNIKVNLLDV